MTKHWMKRLGVVVFTLVLGIIMVGCGDEDEQLKKQMQLEITNVEKQIGALEKHQEAMRQMIAETQSQLQAMQEELDKESPKIHAANVSLKSLRQLNMGGMGPSPAEEVMEDPGWSYGNILWLVFFIFVLWLFYRMRHRNTVNE